MDLHYHPLFNRWLSKVAEADARLDQHVRHHTDTRPIIKRGNR